MDNDTFSQVSEQLRLANEALYAFSDKLITLSAGALTLSIVFRKSLTDSHPSHLWLLQASWVAFMVVILAGTFWNFGKFRAHRRAARQLDQAASGSLAQGDPGPTARAAWTLMLVAFPAALIALTAFAVLNMR